MYSSSKLSNNLNSSELTNKLNTLKWGRALEAGFVVIPTLILRKQKELGLDNGELIVLLNLLMSWWEVDKLPFLQTSSIATRMGLSRRSAQRYIEALERKGFIKRVWGASRGVDERAGASYDLQQTVAKVNALQSLTSPPNKDQ